MILGCFKGFFRAMVDEDDDGCDGDDDDEEGALKSVHHWWEKREEKCIICTDRSFRLPCLPHILATNLFKMKMQNFAFR